MTNTRDDLSVNLNDQCVLVIDSDDENIVPGEYLCCTNIMFRRVKRRRISPEPVEAPGY